MKYRYITGQSRTTYTVILGHLSRLEGIELSKMTIESLILEALQDCSINRFIDQLSDHNAAMAPKVGVVKASGGCLHYAAKVNVPEQTVNIELLSFELSNPFNNAGPNNMIAITTNFTLLNRW